jgi:hypothetical protein
MQFGAASVPGHLEGAGSPQWKQRAFYDFVKDTSPISLDLPVSRVAIWQPIEHKGVITTVGDLLDVVPMANTELTEVGQLLMRVVEEQIFTQGIASND